MEPYSQRNVFWLMALSVFASLVVVSVSARNPCEFPAIFNFGDSNSDTGGLSAAFGQLVSPNGESYFHGPAGRFCDGRLIIDFIAETLGLPYLSPFLDSLAANYTHGANFATGGSPIRPLNLTIHQSGFSPISLDVQLKQFSDFRRRSQIIRRKGGVFSKLMPKEEDFSRALYTFDIGQNDITAAYFVNKTIDQVKASIPELIDGLTTTIKNLYDLGGRSFWIHNTGPFGCLPYALELLPITASEIDEVGCASPFNEVAQYFNHKLKEGVYLLREELQEAAFAYVDVYSVKHNLISDAEVFGFEKPLIACCGYGGKKFNFNKSYFCGRTVTLHGKEIKVGACKDPSVRVNWDGIHYTQAANQWVFHKIKDGAFSNPSIPLKMACHRNLDISYFASS